MGIFIDNSEYEVFAEMEDVSIGRTCSGLLVVNFNNKPKLCIVIEIRSSIKPKKDLKKLAEVALTQIDGNGYDKNIKNKVIKC